MSRAGERARSDTPPGPTGLGRIGVMLELLRDPAAALLRAFHEHGDVFSLPAGRMRVVVVAEPEAAERVLVTNADNYVRGDVMAPLRELSGDNIVTADGAEWRRRRRLANPAFRARFHEALIDEVLRIAEDTVASWLTEPGVIDVDAEMSGATLKVAQRDLLSELMRGEAPLDDTELRAEMPTYVMAGSGHGRDDRQPLPARPRRHIGHPAARRGPASARRPGHARHPTMIDVAAADERAGRLHCPSVQSRIY